MANPYGSPSAVEEQAATATNALKKYEAAHGGKSADEKKLEADAGTIIGKVGDFFGIMVNGVNWIEKLATSGDVTSFMDGGVHLVDEAGKYIDDMLHHKNWKVGNIGAEFGKVITDSLLGETLGITLDKAGEGNGNAIEAVRSIVGFTALFPYAAAGFTFLGKVILANRWPESAGEILGDMPEHLGLNFMLGTLFERVFEQATGRPLEEAINRQVHPNRLDMPVIRALARQHHISEDDFHTELDKMGYPDALKKLIMRMDENQLAPAELQTAFLNGAITESQIKEYLGRLGYSDADVAILQSNYITHAETGAMSVLRTSARTAFQDEEITEGQFRDILKSTNTPDKSIDLEIQAVKLRKNAHNAHLTVANIKQLYQSTMITSDVAHTQLAAIGYSEEDIASLIKLWDSPAAVRAKSLPVGRILSYVAADVLSKEDARARLISLGFRANDADTMVNNPRVRIHVPPVAHKPTTIIAATRDKLIDYGTARTMLVAAGLSESEADSEVQIAQYYVEHRRPQATGQKHLTVGEVSSAIKYGIQDPYWGIGQFEDMGYSVDDAILLVAIALKSPPGDFLGSAGASGGTHPQ